MNNKIHRYIHLFKDRKTMVDVIVDFSEDKVKFSSKIPFKTNPDIFFQNEYYYWLLNSVQSDIMDRLTQSQINNLNKEGLKHLNKYI